MRRFDGDGLGRVHGRAAPDRHDHVGPEAPGGPRPPRDDVRRRIGDDLVEAGDSQARLGQSGLGPGEEAVKAWLLGHGDEQGPAPETGRDGAQLGEAAAAETDLRGLEVLERLHGVCSCQVGLEVDEDLHGPLPFAVGEIVSGPVISEGEVRGLERLGDQRPRPHEPDGLDEIPLLIHERAGQGQLAVLDEAHVDAGPVAVDADRHDGAALLDGVDGLVDGRLGPGALEGLLEALGAEDAGRSVLQGLPAGERNRAEAALAGDLETVFADVRHEDLGARGPGHLPDEIADGPGPEHRDVRPGHRPGPGDGVDAHGRRLDQGPLFES